MAQAESNTGKTLFQNGQMTLKSVGRRSAPLSDLYYFLMTTSWTRFIALFVVVFLALNAVFAGVFLTTGAEIHNAQPGSFRDAFFFSIQTISTVGFGHLSPANTIADTVVALESMLGLLGMAAVTGLIFAKFARPKARIMFSRSAVITSRDGVPSLIFRVANERANHIIDARMRAVYTFLETTPEGEVVRRFVPLQLQRAETPVFTIAWQGTHALVEGSPLFDLDEQALRQSDAEVLVSVSGVDRDLAHPVQAAHSYRVDKLKHGCRLADMFSQGPDGSRLIDYGQFHEFSLNE